MSCGMRHITTYHGSSGCGKQQVMNRTDPWLQVDWLSQECAALDAGDCAFYEDEMEFQPTDPVYHALESVPWTGCVFSI